MIALLGLAGLALLAALLLSQAARWAWMAAALLTAAWTTTMGGVSSGAPLLLAVLAATALEPRSPPRAYGFNQLVGRLVALLAGLAAAVLVVIRVLQADIADDLEVFGLVFLGVAAATYLLLQEDVAERARAARFGIVMAATAWVAGGHAGGSAPLAAGVLVLLVAAAARWMQAE